MQRSTQGERRHSWGRTADLDEHIALLKAEFTGLPEICHRHASLVVRIRRRIEIESAVAEFFELWDSSADELAANLSSRWLVSACDTYADHGSEVQRATALMLSAIVNTIKLAETERLILSDPNPDADKTDELIRKHSQQVHVDLWDGMTAYSIVAGDMPRNLLARLRSVLGSDPVLSVIGETLIGRAIEADTLYGRMARLNPRFAFPRQPSS